MEVDVRMSALNTWMTCEGQAMTYLDEFEIRDGGGPAAHTGTAIGRAIELLHIAELEGEDVTIDQLMARTEITSDEATRPFEKAKWNEVERLLELYAEDGRNQITVIPEVRVSFEMARPEGIVRYKGTFDQLRLVGKVGRVWDLKNGKKAGADMPSMYWAQLFGYTYGMVRGEVELSDDLPRKVRRQIMDADISIGGIMRLQDYLYPLPKAGQKVFYPINITMKSIERALERISDRILEVTSGVSRPLLKPGIHCWWCAHKNHETCLKLDV